MRRASTSPLVVAISTCPRNVETVPSAARTSAIRSTGSRATGSTRPCASNSAATQSSPTTASPVSSQSAEISRLPTACPASSPSPTNRCCSTRDQVRPQVSSPHNAASAIRRSPGGINPNSRRMRPDDPPSSETPTTAVSESVTRRSARSEAARPCPPPSATTDGPVVQLAARSGFIRGPDPGAERPPGARVPAASLPAARPSRHCDACRRCSRSRSSRSACPPGRTRRPRG